jgi:hypothetical protein
MLTAFQPHVPTSEIRVMSRPARIARYRQVAVVGINVLPFPKNIGMTERHAGGLTVPEVDGMLRHGWTLG